MAAENTEIATINLDNEDNYQNNMGILGNLPPEIVQNICMYLTPEDIFNIWTLFPQWNWLINDEYFWQKKCKQNGYFPVEEASKSLCYKKFEERFSHWQATYFYRESVDYNWENSIYEEIPLESEEPLREVYYFDDEMVIATTKNNIIKIFNSITGKPEKCISIPCQGKIIQIKKQDNILVCVTELIVMAWNLQNDSVLNTWTWENRVADVYKLLIYQNFVALVVSLHIGRHMRELIILNVISAIPHSRTPNVTDVLLYDNNAALLVSDSVKVMNTHDHSIKNCLCYSARNHRVMKFLSKNEYIIGLCQSPEHMHFSVWNKGTLDLVTFSAINFPFQNTNIFNFVSFDIMLEDNKLAYNYKNVINDTTSICILYYLTGETILSVDCPNEHFNLCNLGPILKIWNNYFLSIWFKYVLGNKSYVYTHTKMFCSRTGKLLRSFDDSLPEFKPVSEVLRSFTDTKKLKCRSNRTETKKFFSILNFERNTNRYS